MRPQGPLAQLVMPLASSCRLASSGFTPPPVFDVSDLPQVSVLFLLFVS